MTEERYIFEGLIGTPVMAAYADGEIYAEGVVISVHCKPFGSGQEWFAKLDSGKLVNTEELIHAKAAFEVEHSAEPSQGAGDVGGGEPEMTLEEAEKRLKDLFAELPVATEVGGTDGGDQCRVLALELAVHMLAAFKILQRGEDLPDGFFRKLNALKDGADEIEVGGGGLGHGSEAASEAAEGQDGKEAA